MNATGKEIKNFFKYVCLIISITFTTNIINYYIKINWDNKYAWLGILVFAFGFYLLSDKN